MIRASGFLQAFQDASVSIEWRDGSIAGDPLAIDELRSLDQKRSIGGWFVGPGPTDGRSWLTDSIGFAVLCREAFAPGVEIVADAGEALEPEQLPDGAVG